METIEYRTHDKANWGPGPWQDEPDKVQWADEKTGLPCLMVRNGGGALCGYVGVPEGHPWFGNEGDDEGPLVHGGISFTSFCQPGPEDHVICHIPGPGEADHVWWLGFDTSHCGDFQPAYSRSRIIPGLLGDTYRDRAYVAAECALLAAQAKACFT